MEPSPTKTKMAVAMSSARAARMVSGWTASSVLPTANLLGGISSSSSSVCASKRKRGLK